MNHFVNDFAYWLLIYDKHRNKAFDGAFEKYLNEQSEALEIGTGHQAFLTRMAHKYYPKSITSIEENYSSYNESLRVLRKKKITDIQLVHGNSSDLRDEKRYNVLFHEILGSIGSAEGAVQAISFAKEHLLTSDCIHIPGKSVTYFCPVSTIQLNRVSGLIDRFLLGNKNETGFYRVYNYPQSLLMADAALFEELDFQGELSVAEDSRVVFNIKKSGWFDGFVLYIELDFGTEDVVNALYQHTNWSAPYIKILQVPVFLNAGDKIEVKVYRKVYERVPEYKITVSFGAAIPDVEYKWSSTNRWGI